MSNNSRFTGRELSWLQFNERVLEEAIDPSNPLLEQLRFLSIFSSNLDEYFMIRVSGMKGQEDLGLTVPDRKTGFLAGEYLQKMLKASNRLVQRQYEIYNTKIPELNEYVNFSTYQELKPKHQHKLEQYFKRFVFPILTPIRFSSYLPFPLLPNLSVYLISKLEDEDRNVHFSVVTVPKNVERFVQVRKDTFVLLEDIIVNNIDELYEGLKVLEIKPFRITRDFDIEFDDQTDDFAKSVMSELKNRSRGAAVRLEIANDASDEIVDFLKANLMITKRHIFKIDGPLDLTFLNEVHKKVSGKVKDLVFESKMPIQPSVFVNSSSIFEVLRRRDVLLLHPHHSYDPVLRLLKESSEDPSVVAIKQTIYRTNKDSRIMSYLVKAAESGKQVTVLFELRARFDEENNLYWGNILERAGAHVIYGVPHLKTHSKVLLVVRRDKNLVERFVHFSTGNYNEDNAKVYTDVSYFTSKAWVGEDASKFFNYISSYTKKPNYKKMYASPNSIRDLLFEMIDGEIENQKNYQNGHIIIKVNSVSDTKTINKLYEASQEGVRIDMIVRGICCLNPQVEGLSENIHVRSLVGRYLEHMRVYYFNNNGVSKVYISSADLMTRNMENRVELALDISDRTAKRKLYNMLKLQLLDNVKARENINGHYQKVASTDKLVNAQMDLYKILN